MVSSFCSMLDPEIFQSTATRKALVGAVIEDMFCEECWWGRVCGDRENQFEPGPFVRRCAGYWDGRVDLAASRVECRPRVHP